LVEVLVWACRLWRFILLGLRRLHCLGGHLSCSRVQERRTIRGGFDVAITTGTCISIHTEDVLQPFRRVASTRLAVDLDQIIEVVESNSGVQPHTGPYCTVAGPNVYNRL
jgi:hypothetical protein